MKDLKTVCKAPTEELALTNLDIFEEKWVKKYPMCVSSWRNNWAELSTYFKYPEGIRKLIYTTNAMENFNRQLRKVTKTLKFLKSNQAEKVDFKINLDLLIFLCQNQLTKIHKSEFLNIFSFKIFFNKKYQPHPIRRVDTQNFSHYPSLFSLLLFTLNNFLHLF